MQIFLDTADIEKIKQLAKSGMIDGVTTNPSIIAKSGGDVFTVLSEISSIVSGPVSAEVTAEDYDTMMAQAERLRKIADNIAIKVPLTFDGLRACKDLSNDGTMVNVTLCFSVPQALLAAKSGATFVSPFMGRVDDIGYDGSALIYEICDAFANYPEYETMVLAASIRGMSHVRESIMAGCDVITVPPKVFESMYSHPLTQKGIEIFNDDWRKTGQSI